jgi:hypothetical protein
MLFFFDLGEYRGESSKPYNAYPLLLPFCRVDYTIGTCMSEITAPHADIKEAAARIIETAHADGFPLRLLGGLAIYFQCPESITCALTSGNRPAREGRCSDSISCPQEWQLCAMTCISACISILALVEWRPPHG